MRSFSAILLASAGGALAAIDPQYAANLTLYHVNEKNYTLGDITNMNTGDLAGDAVFALRSRYLPIECAGWVPGAPDPTHTHIDCSNPEAASADLAVTKLVVEVDTRFGQYGMCNVHNGVYSCVCGTWGKPAPCGAAVGVENVTEAFLRQIPVTNATVDTTYWFLNLLEKLVGNWYSHVGSGQCGGPGADPGAPCTWRVVGVERRVDKHCSEKVVNAGVVAADPACFSACPQPANATSDCYIKCFYGTLLGAQANETLVPAAMGLGLPAEDILALWDSPFAADSPCPSI